MKKLSIILLTIITMASAAWAVEWKRHPHLQHAHQAIGNAKKQLAEANDHKKTEFGGHRAKAIELLNQAQHEIEEAAEYANSNAN